MTKTEDVGDPEHSKCGNTKCILIVRFWKSGKSPNHYPLTLTEVERLGGLYPKLTKRYIDKKY